MSFALKSFKSALPAFRSAQRVAAVRPVMALRPFSASALLKAGGPAPPQLYGPGGKAGEMPTDEEQATGMERFELLGDIHGVDVFDMKPLEMTRMGTMADPIKVFTLWPERIVGCTGYPADSHDTLWIRCTVGKKGRCRECGCVYELDFQGDPALLEEDDHHHH